jgi:hypothetical protein
MPGASSGVTRESTAQHATTQLPFFPRSWQKDATALQRRRAAAAAGLPWAGFGALEGVQVGLGCGVRGGGLDWECGSDVRVVGPIKLSGCVCVCVCVKRCNPDTGVSSCACACERQHCRVWHIGPEALKSPPPPSSPVCPL